MKKFLVFLLPLFMFAKHPRPKYIRLSIAGGPKVNIYMEEEKTSLGFSAELLTRIAPKRLYLRVEPFVVLTEGKGSISFNSALLLDLMLLFPANRYVIPYGNGGFSGIIDFEKERTSSSLWFGGGVNFLLSSGLYAFGEGEIALRSQENKVKPGIKISGGFRFGKLY